MEGEKNSVVMAGRATIDTSAPFRSVKDAVALFGERIVASQVAASRLSKMQNARENKRHHSSWLDSNHSITAQLQETRQAIKREQEKCTEMANYILALEEELRSTKREIKELRERSYAHVNPSKLETKKGKFFDRKKRHVTFSDPLFAEILNIIVRDDTVNVSRIERKFAR